MEMIAVSFASLIFRTLADNVLMSLIPIWLEYYKFVALKIRSILALRISVPFRCQQGLKKALSLQTTNTAPKQMP
jgi:hypothetical protein